jgi:hypothetical protein
MITSLILQFFSAFLGLLLSPFPVVTTLPVWSANVLPVFAVIGGLGALPFLGDVVQIGMLVLAILAGWQVVVFANWLYNKVRGSG